MKKIFYEKKGRRYVPVSEYDNELIDSFAKGTHLVMVYPGGRSTRYNVDPNYAAMIAAGRVAEDAISNALYHAGQIRMQRKDREKTLTPEQKAAWENLVKELGESAHQLEWASSREVAEAGIKAMMEEAEKLLTVPVVKKAFEHFLLVCELTKEDKNELSR